MKNLLKKINKFFETCPNWQLRVAVAIIGLIPSLVIGYFFPSGFAPLVLFVTCATLSVPDFRSNPVGNK